MKKKIIIISLIVLGVIGLGIGGFFLVKNFNNKPEETKEEKKEEKKVVSTILLDINPSLKVYLDEDSKVIKMEALNDDAKDIVYDDCAGKELDYVIYKIVGNLVDKGYTEDKLTILVSATGEVKSEQVETIIKNEFTSSNIEGTVIAISETSDEAKEKAKEYGISDSKASFIEEIIKDKNDLSFEELKDKSIAELNEIKNKKEEPKQEEKKEEQKKNTGGNNGSSGNSGNSGNSGTVAYSCTPPSDIKSVEWCNWNIKRPQSCEYYYPMRKDYMELEKIAHSALGFSENDIVNGGAYPKVHAGASYCESYYAEMKYQDTMYYIELDSVTGEVLSKSQKTITYAITEEQAKQMAIAYWKINAEDIDTIWVSNGTDGKPNGPGTYIRFQVNMQMKDGKKYSVDYDATTGQYVSSRSW